jgi:hypothetical protein
MTVMNWLPVAIATLALAVSIWAVIETRRSRVAPHLVAETNRLIDNGGQGEPIWRLSVVNRGDGAAYDVRVVLEGLPPNPRSEPHRSILLPGESIEVSANLTKRLGRRQMPLGVLMIQYDHERHRVDPTGLSAAVLWRQHASVDRIRKQRIRRPEDSSEGQLTGRPSE